MPWLSSLTTYAEKVCQRLLQNFEKYLIGDVHLNVVDLIKGRLGIKNASFEVSEINAMLDEACLPFNIVNVRARSILMSIPQSRTSVVRFGGLEISLQWKHAAGGDLADFLCRFFCGMTTPTQLAEDCLQEKLANLTTSGAKIRLESLAQIFHDIFSKSTIVFNDTVIRVRYVPENYNHVIKVQVDEIKICNVVSRTDKKPKSKKSEETSSRCWRFRTTGVRIYLNEVGLETYSQPAQDSTEEGFVPSNYGFEAAWNSKHDSVTLSLEDAEKHSDPVLIGQFFTSQTLALSICQNENDVTAAPNFIVECSLGSLAMFLTPCQVRRLVEFTGHLSLCMKQHPAHMDSSSPAEDCGFVEVKSFARTVQFELGVMILTVLHCSTPPAVTSLSEHSERYFSECQSIVGDLLKCGKSGRVCDRLGKVCRPLDHLCLLAASIKGKTRFEALRCGETNLSFDTVKLSECTFSKPGQATKPSSKSTKLYKTKSKMVDKTKPSESNRELCAVHSNLLVFGAKSDAPTSKGSAWGLLHPPPTIKILIKYKSPEAIMTSVHCDLSACKLEVDISILDRISPLLHSLQWKQKAPADPEDDEPMLVISAPLLKIGFHFPIVPRREAERPFWQARWLREETLILEVRNITFQALPRSLNSKTGRQPGKEFEVVVEDMHMLYADEPGKPKSFLRISSNHTEATADRYQFLKVTILLEGNEQDNASGNCTSDNEEEEILKISKGSPTPFTKAIVSRAGKNAILPGNATEREEFSNHAILTSQVLIEMNLPAVNCLFESKQFLESLYNRIKNDLLSWAPAAPKPRMGPKTASSAGDVNEQCSNVTSPASTNRGRLSVLDALCKIVKLRVCTSMKTGVARVVAKYDSICSEGAQSPREPGEVVLFFRKASLCMLKSYRGNPLLDYASLQVSQFAVYHGASIPSSAIRSFLTHVERFVEDVPCHLVKVASCAEEGILKNFADRKEGQDMLAIAVKTKTGKDRLTNHRLVSVLVQQMVLHHSLKKSSIVSGLEKFINFFSISDYSVLGGTEIHLNAENSAAVVYGTTPAFGVLIAADNLSVFKGLLLGGAVLSVNVASDGWRMFMTDQHRMLVVDLQLDYACVLDVENFALDLLFKNQPSILGQYGDTKASYPLTDLHALVDKIQFLTCADSCAALVGFVRYLADNAEMKGGEQVSHYVNQSESGTARLVHDAMKDFAESDDDIPAKLEGGTSISSSSLTGSLDLTDTKSDKGLRNVEEWESDDDITILESCLINSPNVADGLDQTNVNELLADAMRDHVEPDDQIKLMHDGTDDIPAKLKGDSSTSSILTGFNLTDADSTKALQNVGKLESDDDITILESCLSNSPNSLDQTDVNELLADAMRDHVEPVNTIRLMHDGTDDIPAKLKGGLSTSSTLTGCLDLTDAESAKASHDITILESCLSNSPNVAASLDQTDVKQLLADAMRDHDKPDDTVRAMHDSSTVEPHKIDVDDHVEPEEKAVARYYLKISSCVWCMYGGFDFKTTESSSGEVASCRDPKTLVQVHLSLMQAQYKEYPVGELLQAEKVLSVSDFEMKGKLKRSGFVEYLPNLVYENPCASPTNALKVVVSQMRAQGDSAPESQLSISFLRPLEFDIDGGAVIFLANFFSDFVSKADEQNERSAQSSVVQTSGSLGHQASCSSLMEKTLYGKIVFESEVLIKLNFRDTSTCSNRRFLSGLLAELEQFGSSQLKLTRVDDGGYFLTPDELIKYLLREWIANVSSTALERVGFTNSMALLLKVIRDMTGQPLRQYLFDVSAATAAHGLSKSSCGLATQRLALVPELQQKEGHLGKEGDNTLEQVSSRSIVKDPLVPQQEQGLKEFWKVQRRILSVLAKSAIMTTDATTTVLKELKNQINLVAKTEDLD